MSKDSVLGLSFSFDVDPDPDGKGNFGIFDCFLKFSGKQYCEESHELILFHMTFKKVI
jgi:hypothetical protein